MRVVFKAVFGHIAHIHRGLGGEQKQRLEQRQLVGIEAGRARGQAFV